MTDLTPTTVAVPLGCEGRISTAIGPDKSARFFCDRVTQAAVRRQQRYECVNFFPLLRLPAEVRLRIYAYAVGYQNASILLKPKSWHTTHALRQRLKKGSPKLTITSAVIACRKETAYYYVDNAPGTGVNIYPLPRCCRVCGECAPIPGSPLDLSLLLVSRQLCHEVSAELYGRATFVFITSHLLSAFLHQVGEQNAARIRHVRIYYARMSYEIAWPLGFWLSNAWECRRGIPEIRKMSRLQSLHLVNVVGAGFGVPWWPTLGFNKQNLSVLDGGWAGDAGEVWRNGRRRIPKCFRALDEFSKVKIGRIEVEVDDRWLDYIQEPNRRAVYSALQLDSRMKRWHIQNMRERVTWRDPEDVDDVKLKQVIKLWNNDA